MYYDLLFPQSLFFRQSFFFGFIDFFFSRYSSLSISLILSEGAPCFPPLAAKHVVDCLLPVTDPPFPRLSRVFELIDFRFVPSSYFFLLTSAQISVLV